MKNKIFLGTLFIILFLGAILTTTVNAQSTVTVQDITSQDTLHTGTEKPTPDITTDGNTITVTYNAASLKIIGEGTGGQASEGRPAGYAWLGIRITPPTEATKYKVDGEEETITGGTVDAYFGISEAKLEEATREERDLTYTKTYSWLKDEDQPVEDPSETIIKIVVKTSGIELYDEQDTTAQWNEEKYDEIVAEVEASKQPPVDTDDPADDPTDDDNPTDNNEIIDDDETTDNLDDEKKTGIEATPIIAISLVAIISLAGFVISKNNNI